MHKALELRTTPHRGREIWAKNGSSQAAGRESRGHRQARRSVTGLTFNLAVPATFGAVSNYGASYGIVETFASGFDGRAYFYRRGAGRRSADQEDAAGAASDVLLRQLLRLAELERRGLPADLYGR